MMLSWSFVAVLYLALGCQAEIDGPTSDPAEIWSAVHIARFEGIPAGGLVCDRAANTSVLFEADVVRQTITRMYAPQLGL